MSSKGAVATTTFDRSLESSAQKPSNVPGRAVGIWLVAMAVAIWLMVIIGGVTRLTGSGLSITEWRPIMGTIPPLNDTQWHEAFDKYRATPQFRLTNPDITLGGFQFIFFWEYFHRLWGRLLGLFFAIPFAWFAFTGQLNRSWGVKLGIALVLGGFQGLLGWIMVQSGLVDKPWVSPYRLSAHLLLALALFSYVLWMACDILIKRKSIRHPAWVRSAVVGLLALFTVQTLWGGFMAGGKLALSYPTFPDLNGSYLPAALWTYQGFFHYFCENPATVHLIHRSLAVVLVIAIIGFWFATKPLRWAGSAGLARHLLLAGIIVQFLLGVLTVLQSIGQVALVPGATHQATAVLLLAALIVLCHQTFRGSQGESKP